MPKLQPYRQQLTPSSRTGGARANPGAMSSTGAEMVGRGIASVGGAMNDVAKAALQVQGMMDEVELSNAERSRDEHMLKVFQEIEAEPNYRKHEEIFRKGMEGVSQFVPASKPAADAYTRRVNQLAPYWQSKLHRHTTTRMTRTIDADTQLAIEQESDAIKEAILEDRDDDLVLHIDNANEAIERRVKYGLLTSKQAQAMKDDLEYSISHQQAWRHALSYDTFEEGSGYLLQEDLREEDRADMVRELEVVHDKRKAARIEATKELQEAERLQVVEQLAANTLTWEAIQSTSLDAQEKNMWRERMEARAKALAVEEEDPFEVYAPGVAADIAARIDTDQPITVEEIYQLVGAGKDGGITWQQAQQFAGDLAAREKAKDTGTGGPLDNETYKNLVRYMEDFRKSGFFIWGQDLNNNNSINYEDLSPEQRLENDVLFESVLSDFRRWMKTNPDASDVQIREKYESLINPTRDQVAITAVQGLFQFAAREAHRREQRRQVLWNRLKAGTPSQGMPEEEGELTEAEAEKLIAEMPGQASQIYRKWKGSITAVEFLERWEARMQGRQP